LTSADWSAFNSKQSALISGTNIKTINGTSILGSGDLVVEGGISSLNVFQVDEIPPTGGKWNHFGISSSVQIFNLPSSSSSSRGLSTSADWSAFNSKQSALISGTISTINGSSILGSGDLTISGSDSTKLPLAGGTMTGSLLFTDNSYDIGASGSTRPRSEVDILGQV